MNFPRILAIALITLCTAVAWFILGSALTLRTAESSGQMGNEVTDVWGPIMDQAHPSAFYLSPTGARGKVVLQPTKSRVAVNLDYDPKKRGLLWHRTYSVSFSGEYEIANPTPIAQTIYVQFPLPSQKVSYQNFAFMLGDSAPRQTAPKDGIITEAVVVPPKSTVPLSVKYASRGMDTWRYQFPDASRVRGFELVMTANFDEINFPKGTGSPNSRDEKTKTYTWSYPDVISAAAIGMDMPKVLNAGPVAARIAFFAPVSLVFFFAVLLIVGMVQGVNMHPMNYFFLAAGCFAFQLLFAYLVDLVPLMQCFSIASLVSMVLVCGYVWAVAGPRMFWVSLPAQFAYMVLFSYSFFFDGLTGLTLTIGAILTLGLLMILTAKVEWATIFTKVQTKPMPPQIPMDWQAKSRG
jgi:hypothetical protein